MCATQPVTFLTEMALPTELITVIEINLSALFILKIVSVVRVVAVNTAQLIPFPTMIYDHITMGQL